MSHRTAKLHTPSWFKRERRRPLSKTMWPTQGGLGVTSPGMMGDPGILPVELELKKKKVSVRNRFE